MKRQGNFYYYNTMEDLQQAEQGAVSAKMRLLYDYRAPAGASSRWSPTSAQLQELQSLFYIGGLRTPTTAQISRITARLRAFGRIEGRNVFYWFQNQKARERKRRLELMQQQQQQEQQKQPSDCKFININNNGDHINDINECNSNVENEHSNVNTSISINNLHNYSHCSDSINSNSDNMTHRRDQLTAAAQPVTRSGTGSVVACCSSGSPSTSAVSPPSPPHAAINAPEMSFSLRSDIRGRRTTSAPPPPHLQRPIPFISESFTTTATAAPSPIYSLHQNINDYPNLINNYDISYDNYITAGASSTNYNSSTINPDNLLTNTSIIKSPVSPLVLFPLSPELDQAGNHSQSNSSINNMNSCCVSYSQAQRRLSAGSPSAINFSPPLLQLDLKLAFDY